MGPALTMDGVHAFEWCWAYPLQLSKIFLQVLMLILIKYVHSSLNTDKRLRFPPCIVIIIIKLYLHTINFMFTFL